MAETPTPADLPDVPILPGFEHPSGNYWTVTLYDRTNQPTRYRVGRPLPVLVHCQGDRYTLSDRTAAWYHFVP